MKTKIIIAFCMGGIAIVLGWRLMNKEEAVRKTAVKNYLNYTDSTLGKSMEHNEPNIDATIIGNHEVEDGKTDGSTLQKPFTIYVNYKLYAPETQAYLQNNGYGEYKIITNSVIDPKKSNKINEKNIRKNLISRFPQKESEGICIINWERTHWFALKNQSPGREKFDIAEKEYIKLIRFIRSERPNLKIGIFGIPFRMSDTSMRRFNRGDKFKKLLGHTDFIAPSLYIEYTEKEVGYQGNVEYLEENMKTAFEYGKSLNKPVIPFVWYRVHPRNKKYGLQVLSKEFMLKYLKIIKAYRYKGVRAEGVFWWEPGIDKADPMKLKRLGNKATAQDSLEHAGRDKIIKTHTKSFYK